MPNACIVTLRPWGPKWLAVAVWILDLPIKFCENPLAIPKMPWNMCETKNPIQQKHIHIYNTSTTAALILPAPILFSTKTEVSGALYRFGYRWLKWRFGKSLEVEGYEHDGETPRNTIFEITFFPTCQVRVVRFYVSLPSPPAPPPHAPPASPPPAGPQPRSGEISVARRTSTAIL